MAEDSSHSLSARRNSHTSNAAWNVSHLLTHTTLTHTRCIPLLVLSYDLKAVDSSNPGSIKSNKPLTFPARSQKYLQSASNNKS